MRFITLLLSIFSLLTLFSQPEYQQFFDGADTLGSDHIEFYFENDSNLLWQVGIPMKTVFDEALSLPNALMTDTMDSYPISTSESTGFHVNIEEWGGWWGILAIRWAQKLDLQDSADFGFVEFGLDSTNWQNAFDNPYVYDFYGYDEGNVFSQDGELGFSGTDSTWNDIWLCYDLTFMDWEDTLSFRFRFESDSVDTQQDGWMIDNCLSYITILHTLEEEDSGEYMKVYPTVTDSRVFIEGRKLQEPHAIDHIDIYDAQGSLVRRIGQRPVKTFIDLDGLTEGRYLIEITTNKEVNTYSVILKR